MSRDWSSCRAERVRSTRVTPATTTAMRNAVGRATGYGCLTQVGDTIVVKWVNRSVRGSARVWGMASDSSSEQVMPVPMSMTVPMNILRVLLAGAITTLAGSPMLCVIYSTYIFGLVCSWLGRKDILDKILAWNAWFAGTVAQRLWARPLLSLVSVRVKTRGDVN